MLTNIRTTVGTCTSAKLWQFDLFNNPSVSKKRSTEYDVVSVLYEADLIAGLFRRIMLSFSENKYFFSLEWICFQFCCNTLSDYSLETRDSCTIFSSLSHNTLNLKFDNQRWSGNEGGTVPFRRAFFFIKSKNWRWKDSYIKSQNSRWKDSYI